jgi:hypothetical protein
MNIFTTTKPFRCAHLTVLRKRADPKLRESARGQARSTRRAHLWSNTRSGPSSATNESSAPPVRVRDCALPIRASPDHGKAGVPSEGRQGRASPRGFAGCRELSNKTPRRSERLSAMRCAVRSSKCRPTVAPAADHLADDATALTCRPACTFHPAARAVNVAILQSFVSDLDDDVQSCLCYSRSFDVIMTRGSVLLLPLSSGSELSAWPCPTRDPSTSPVRLSGPRISGGGLNVLVSSTSAMLKHHEPRPRSLASARANDYVAKPATLL